MGPILKPPLRRPWRGSSAASHHEVPIISQGVMFDLPWYQGTGATKMDGIRPWKWPMQVKSSMGWSTAMWFLASNPQLCLWNTYLPLEILDMSPMFHHLWLSNHHEFHQHFIEFHHQPPTKASNFTSLRGPRSRSATGAVGRPTAPGWGSPGWGSSVFENCNMISPKNWVYNTVGDSLRTTRFAIHWCIYLFWNVRW